MRNIQPEHLLCHFWHPEIRSDHDDHSTRLECFSAEVKQAQSIESIKVFYNVAEEYPVKFTFFSAQIVMGFSRLCLKPFCMRRSNPVGIDINATRFRPSITQEF